MPTNVYPIITYTMFEGHIQLLISSFFVHSCYIYILRLEDLKSYMTTPTEFSLMAAPEALERGSVTLPRMKLPRNKHAGLPPSMRCCTKKG